ncbi:MAG: Gfo/Idh/MocA family oxidoreductase, partial [Candidatus Bathyarchaeia archaeon]|nr:Gfo/Idh/MocA family oxidoreductase [Candidatus Bathyarchaeia archaeon]
NFDEAQRLCELAHKLGGVGLVGCGRVSQIHMNAYKNIPEVNVIAVSDINLERAKNFAQKYKIPKAYDDTIKIFELKDLDFVDICTPISTHAKLSCEAAKYGHNIFLEKPMARNSRECDQVNQRNQQKQSQALHLSQPAILTHSPKSQKTN